MRKKVCSVLMAAIIEEILSYRSIPLLGWIVKFLKSGYVSVDMKVSSPDILACRKPRSMVIKRCV
jgi:hypothetical protein